MRSKTSGSLTTAKRQPAALCIARSTCHSGKDTMSEGLSSRAQAALANTANHCGHTYFWQGRVLVKRLSPSDLLLLGRSIGACNQYTVISLIYIRGECSPWDLIVNAAQKASCLRV